MDEPTILTRENLETYFNKLMKEEIKPHYCFKCSKEYFLNSYGHHIGECDECWFSRFPKEEVREFYRSFFNG